MKKWSLVLNVLLLVVVAVLVAEGANMRARLRNAQVEIAQWELYATFTMNQMRGLSYDGDALKTPERKLPDNRQERLLALAERVERRVDRCVVANARLTLALAGYKGPHLPPED